MARSQTQGPKGPPERRPLRSLLLRKRMLLLGLLPVALLLFSCSACSPIYLARAGWAEMKILSARRPLDDVILDPSTGDDTRGKLLLVREARIFAIEALELDAGDSYTTFTRLEKDTLAMVLSAAYQDRLAPKTWWYPVVGRVPYRGFFDFGAAEKARGELESDGFDTYLRPTSAFSTLGWFSDPLLSTLLRYDVVELVETVIHELSHNHLFVSGQVRFNESYATFVGRVGAIQFFCTREGGGPDTQWCLRAQARWEDYQRFSSFLDPLVDELEALFGREDLSREAKVRQRESVFRDAQTRFRAEVQPELRSARFQSFLETPLNNATLLARMRYYHRLSDFQSLLDDHGGDLQAAVTVLKEGVGQVQDPFQLLPDRGR
ncbi:aminopeptidase [Gemmatimonadota bacterium]